MNKLNVATYTNPEDFRVNVPGTKVDLVLTSGKAFQARLTRVKLPHLTLVLIEETAPRIAFISPDPGLVFISFPLRGKLVSNGARQRRGDFTLHGAGEHLHQLAEDNTRWGQISIRTKDLATYGHALLGRTLTPPRAAQFLRTRTQGASDILRLHTLACRLVATKPDMMAHREVARSIEQELIVPVVNLLGTSKVSDPVTNNRQRRADIMARFEWVLAARDHQQRLPALRALIGVPERTLRICCETFLGLSPLEYIRMRRLNLARAALCKADRKNASVAAIARGHGFSEPGRFAGIYRALFGESPSATLMRNSTESA